MIPPAQLTGAVLAGGHSRRMGKDKAALVVNGQPLWLRQVGVLRAAGAATVGIVRRADQPPLPLDEGIPLWVDAVADAGPLAGLHAALTACRTDWVAVLAVDLPRIDAGWFAGLAGLCGSGRGAAAQHADGAFEPLAAIYPRAALAEVTTRLRGPDFSLQALAAALFARQLLARVPLPDADRWRLENWNTPADAIPSPADTRP